MKSAILLLGLSAVFLGGCGASESGDQPAQAGTNTDEPETEYVAPDAKGIQTTTVKLTSIPDYLDLPAHIEADPTRVVHVFAPAGGRITEMKVRPWDRVEKGKTLAILESSDLARAVADYHKALVDNQVKQKALARAADLYAHGAMAEKDYQQAQGDVDMAQAELKATREQVQVFGMDPDHAEKDLRVVAPRSGVILDVGAAPGEFSKSLDAPAPLCTIADITTIWAVGDIYEKDLATAKSGLPADVSLNAYPEQHWAGRVSVVSDAVDPATRTLHVRVVLENPRAQIKPQMFGRIRILRSSSPGILVPSAAVIREGGDAYIFVEKTNSRFERRNVKLGRSLDGLLEILSGVQPGATVISEGALLLKGATNPS
jgi:membrane fusion protein, heavy metal efflux system